jgi:hypothetical protein
MFGDAVVRTLAFAINVRRSAKSPSCSRVSIFLKKENTGYPGFLRRVFAASSEVIVHTEAQIA